MSLREAVNRIFDESFWDPFEGFSGLALKPGRDVFSLTLFPKVDISETDKEIKVVANVPGIDPDKIEIEVDDETLKISGRLEKEQKHKDKRFYRFEREYGEFSREFVLPTAVVTKKIRATAKNGVLTLVLPKAEPAKRKKVKVKAE